MAGEPNAAERIARQRDDHLTSLRGGYGPDTPTDTDGALSAALFQLLEIDDTVLRHADGLAQRHPPRDTTHASSTALRLPEARPSTAPGTMRVWTSPT